MKRSERNESNRSSLNQDLKSSLETPNANTLEVISGGKLSDIARPSISRGSARSLSQLSSQSKASFELEALPDERDVPYSKWSTKTEVPVDDIQCCDENLGIESTAKRTPVQDHDYVEGDGRDIPSSTQGKHVSSSSEFEKEILKISKRVIRSKNKKHTTTELEKSVEKFDDSKIKSEDFVESQSDVKEENIPDESDKENDLPPKIKKGLEKIKKLDDLLAEKVKLEKEVKADRKRMEKEWQVEMKSFMEWCGDNKSRPVIQQFLALTNGIADDGRFEGGEAEEDFVPVFPTELDTSSEEKKDSMTDGNDKVENKERSQTGSNDAGDKQNDEGHSTGKKKKKKDFLKRNIELASHANEIIALTEEERVRLDELLSDDSDLLSFENPFSKNSKAVSVTGYELDENSKRALDDIDEKLKLLVQESDFQSICSTPFSDRMSVSHRSLDFSETEYDRNVNTKCKEPALQEGKDFRDMANRLQQIELELGRIDQLKDEEYDLESPRISHELLRQLIDVDDRLTSSALSILDSSQSQSQMTERTLSPTSTDPSESVLQTYRSSNTDKSFCSVGV